MQLKVDAEAADGPQENKSQRASSAGSNKSLIAQSLDKIRLQAKALEKARKYDPNKYSKVKSKIGRNIKVINKTKAQRIQ